jgi:phosphate butyryltransferase
MPLAGWEQLFQDADDRRPLLPVSVAGGADRTALEALRAALDRGWVRPVVAGPAADVRRLAAEVEVDLDGFTLIDAEDAAAAAVAEVRAGRARLLMKGRVATPDLMRAVLGAHTGLRTGRTICQVVLMEVVPARRRFLLADTGVCARPTLAQKGDILGSAAELARRLSADPVRVAVMAATEAVNESLPDTFDAAELARLGQEGKFPGCVVQGPLSFDLAYAAEAGDRKGVGGTVVGAADVMLFPELTAANLTVKAIMYTADCRFGGVLCGAACPVAFMSRADSTPTRLRSLALALKMTDR